MVVVVVGATLGREEGTVLGAILGNTLGTEDGVSEGRVDGCTVGKWLGKELGNRLGLDVSARKAPQIPWLSTRLLNVNMKGSVYHGWRMSAWRISRAWTEKETISVEVCWSLRRSRCPFLLEIVKLVTDGTQGESPESTISWLAFWKPSIK